MLTARPRRPRRHCYWNDDGVSIDFNRFCTARFLRAGLRRLTARVKSVTVHNLLPSHISVPRYVLRYLNMGTRFIQDRPRGHDQNHAALRGVAHLQRQLRNSAFFNDGTEAHRPLRNKHIKSTNTWSPPPDHAADTFCRLLRDELRNYTPSEYRNNGMWSDKAARKWLKENRDTVMIIDCDKNLGDALASRPWVEELTTAALHEAFTLLTPTRRTVLEELKATLRHLFATARENSIIDNRTFHYLDLSFTLNCTGGIFRIRLKIHKTPNIGRPIANLAGTWAQAVGHWLCEQLAPLAKSQRAVISSSHDFLCRFLPRQLPSKEHQFYTVDITNLYPSVDTSDLITKIAPRIRALVKDQEKASLIITAINITLKCGVVRHDDQEWICVQGIPTGFSPACHIANLYLAESDEQAIEQHNLQNLFARYIDDAWICSRPQDIHGVLETLNMFHPAIHWEVTHSERAKTIFLDLELVIEPNGDIGHRIFRKPQSACMYVPAGSCHLPHTHVGLIRGEVTRAYRLCRTHGDAKRDIGFFCRKLARRGFEHKVVQQIAFQHFDRLSRRAEFDWFRCKRRAKVHRLPFMYSSVTNARTLRRALKKNHQLIRHLGAVGISWKLQKSRFIECYKHNYRAGR